MLPSVQYLHIVLSYIYEMRICVSIFLFCQPHIATLSMQSYHGKIFFQLRISRDQSSACWSHYVCFLSNSHIVQHYIALTPSQWNKSVFQCVHLCRWYFVQCNVKVLDLCETIYIICCYSLLLSCQRWATGVLFEAKKIHTDEYNLCVICLGKGNNISDCKICQHFMQWACSGKISRVKAVLCKSSASLRTTH